MIVDHHHVKIPTWTEPETLRYWAELAKQSEHIVESGCYMGASTRAMLEANRSVHIWTVDHFRAFAFNKEVAEIFLGTFIREGRCELIAGDMDKAGQMLLHMNGKIDAVIVDDGHAEEDLRRDIRNALPLLKPGGILSGHDWDFTNDVARGVRSMISEDKLTFPVPRVWQFVKP